MGGKTQRKSGNVKPSNSERIRDLMINTHGTGNIITFSALATNQNIRSKQVADRTSKPEPADEKPIAKPSPVETTPTEALPSPSLVSSSNEKGTYKLVLKRVGNRDLFVRVRVTDDISTEKISDNLRVVDSEKSGVYRPPSSVEQNENPETTESLDSHESPADDKDSTNPSEQIDEPEKEEEYDFDTVLDQLDCLKASIRRDVESYAIDDTSIALDTELIRLLDILVRKFNKDLSIEEWDLIVSSVLKWVKSMSMSSEHLLDDTSKINFSANVFNFIRELIQSAQRWSADPEISEEEFPMLKSLLDDWNNFHSSVIFQDLIILYFKIVSCDNLNQDHLKLIESLSSIICEVDAKLLISNPDISIYPVGKLIVDHETFELPKNCQYCEVDDKKFKGFSAICNLFKSNQRVISVTAHSILRKNISDLCANVRASCASNNDEINENLSFVPPKDLMSILSSRDSIMSALLSDYQVGDISVTIDPDSDSYTCTLTYLFVWDLVIQFIVGQDKEVAHHMIHCLKKLGLIQRLLDNIFMLLPPLGERDSLDFRIESDAKRGNDIQPWCLSNFLKTPLKTTIKRPINEIELTALHVYFSVASHMPVTVRKWYNNNSNKRLCNLVNEYTVKHISKVICSLEMETVQEKCQERANEDKMNNLVIKARPTAGEVYAIYTRDEFRMELTIKLPVNYPLGPVHIDGGKRIGVTDLKWRSWLLQLTTFLSHQNGPILDGIDLWRRNIDKRFEGVEKCMICFSILHSNYQLPKKKCQTCTKMFHNLCLYKWFETSGNSTCPLCRNIW